MILLEPGGGLDGLGEDLEEGGPQGAVVVPPHTTHTAKPLHHLLVALQQSPIAGQITSTITLHTGITMTTALQQADTHIVGTSVKVFKQCPNDNRTTLKLK